MSLKSYFHWKPSDASLNWHLRAKDIFRRGIFFGGEIQANASELSVTVTRFVAMGADGMVIREDDQDTTIALADGQEWYICLWARYRVGTPPILEWKAYTAATYASHEEQDYLIVFGRVVIPAGATNTTTSMIWSDVRHANDPVGRLPIRIVASASALPQGVEDGDLAYVVDENTIYSFRNTTSPSGEWIVLLVYTELVHGYALAQRSVLWKHLGSGVLGGRAQNGSGPAPSRYVELDFHGHTNYRLGIGEITAAVGGHLLATKHVDYDLPDPPTVTTYNVEGKGDTWFELAVGAPGMAVNDRVAFFSNPNFTFRVMAVEGNRGYVDLLSAASRSAFAAITTGDEAWIVSNRYDVLFLEVWRELVASVDALDITRADTSTMTLEEALQALERNADTPGESGQNFDIAEIQYSGDHDLVVLKYRIGILSNTNVTAEHLWDTSKLLRAADLTGDRPVNRNGNAFVQYNATVDSSAPEYRDRNMWIADSNSSYDGQTWAIPLVAIKRRSGESGLTISPEDGDNTIEPLYPYVLLGNEDQAERPLRLSDTWSTDGVCGFLEGGETSLQFSVTASGEADSALAVSHCYRLPPCHIQAGPAFFDKRNEWSVVFGGYAPAEDGLLVLSVLEVRLQRRSSALGWNSEPFLLMTDDGRIVPMYWVGQLTAYANTSGVSIYHPMEHIGGIAGFSKLASLYSKPESNRPVYGVPLAWISRLNTEAFDETSSSGWLGATGRPDFAKYGAATSSVDVSGILHPDTTLDLRQSVVDDVQLDRFLDNTMGLLTSGQLRTRMARHPNGQKDNRGTRLLDTGVIAEQLAGEISGDYQIGTVHGTTVADQNLRGIFSEARELYPITVTFAVDADNENEPGSEFVRYHPYDALEVSPHTRIELKAPPGAYIMTDQELLVPWSEAKESWESYDPSYPVPDVNIPTSGLWYDLLVAWAIAAGYPDDSVPGTPDEPADFLHQTFNTFADFITWLETNAENFARLLRIHVPITRRYYDDKNRSHLTVYDGTSKITEASGLFKNCLRDFGWFSDGVDQGIIARDAKNRPTHMIIRHNSDNGFLSPIQIDKTAGSFCTLTFYVVFDREPSDSDYDENHGLRMIPERIEEVELRRQTNSGGDIIETTYRKMAPHMILAEVAKTSDAALADEASVTFTYTAADIADYIQNSGRFRVPRGVTIDPDNIKIYGVSPLRSQPSQLAVFGETRVLVGISSNDPDELPLGVLEYDMWMTLSADQQTLTITIKNQTGRPIATGEARTAGRTLSGGITVTALLHFDHRVLDGGGVPVLNDANNLFDWVDVIKPTQAVRARFEYAQFEETDPPDIDEDKFYPIFMDDPSDVTVNGCGALLEQMIAIWAWDSGDSIWRSIPLDVSLPAENLMMFGKPYRTTPYDMGGGVFLGASSVYMAFNTGTSLPWYNTKILACYIKQTPLVCDGTVSEALRLWYLGEPYQGIGDDLPQPDYNVLPNTDEDNPGDYPHSPAMLAAMYGTGKMLAVSPVTVSSAGSGASYLNAAMAIAGTGYKTGVPRHREYLQMTGAPNEVMEVGIDATVVEDWFAYHDFASISDLLVQVVTWLQTGVPGGLQWRRVFEVLKLTDAVMREYPSMYRDVIHYARKNPLDFWFLRKAGAVNRLPFHNADLSPFMDMLGQVGTSDPIADKIQDYIDSYKIYPWDMDGDPIDDAGNVRGFGDYLVVPMSAEENVGKLPHAGMISSLFEWIVSTGAVSDYMMCRHSMFDSGRQGFCVARRHFSTVFPDSVNIDFIPGDILRALLNVFLDPDLAPGEAMQIAVRFFTREQAMLCPGISPLPYGNLRDYAISGRTTAGGSSPGSGLSYPPYTAGAGIRVDKDIFYTAASYLCAPWMMYASRNQAGLTDYDWWPTSDVHMTVSGHPQKRVVSTTQDTSATYKGNTDVAKPGGVFDVFVPVHRPILRNVSAEYMAMGSMLKSRWEHHPIFDDAISGLESLRPFDE